MKKTMWISITLMLLAALLVGCGADAAKAAPEKEEAQTGEESEATLSAAALGGWTVPESYELSDEVRGVFDKATEGLIGVNYEPVACLGSQIVSGTNYAVFCAAQAVSPTAKPYYAVMYLYESLDGKAEVTNIIGVTPNGELDENAGTAGALAGGWSVPESEEDGMEAYQKAIEGLVGVSYTPIRVMGEQVVSGMNYCVLCQAKEVYPDAKPYYGFALIYRDLSGNVKLTDITAFEAWQEQ